MKVGSFKTCLQSGLQGPRVYLFHKSEGMSTFDVIRRVRPYITRNLTKKKREKIGHFGTLDPFASGLVLVAVGGATRLNSIVHEYLPKGYLAKGVLGEKRDTGDVSGKTLEKIRLDPKILKMGREELSQKWSFLLERPYGQRPPLYSAAKHQGKGLYEYARQGIAIEKPPVLREIYELEVRECLYPEVAFFTRVSSGTYVRVLWEDMAQALGGVGYLKSLKRVSYGNLSLEMALPLPERGQERAFFEKTPLPCLRPHELLNFEKVYASRGQAQKLLSGNPFTLLEEAEKRGQGGEHYCWVFGEDGHLLSLGRRQGSRVVPKVNFLG